MMETIDILLASYNGSIFIENQILSIIGQTYKNWILYKGNNKCRLKDYKYIKIEDYKKIYEEKYDYMEKMAEINYTKSNQVIAVISVIIAILAIICS